MTSRDWNCGPRPACPHANAQFTYTLFRDALDCRATNSLQPFSISNFVGGQAIPILNNVGQPFFFTPCSGSPLAYDPGKVEMITNLSVVTDTNRTWDNNGPPTPGGVGGSGTKMGAWTFGKLMTDMANVGSPGNTVTSASDFVTRVFESWQNQQMINNDPVPAVPNLRALRFASVDCFCERCWRDTRATNSTYPSRRSACWRSSIASTCAATAPMAARRKTVVCRRNWAEKRALYLASLIPTRWPTASISKLPPTSSR